MTIDPTRPDANGIGWVPVRHHSPAAARAVRELIDSWRPTAVLIEGPADFTEMPLLGLGHRLPISIMSWVRPTDLDQQGNTSYALYPLTSFSPEWQAIEHGGRSGARVEFIDLPWPALLRLGHDDEAGRDGAPALVDIEPDRAFFESLAQYAGRPTMTSVWDEFFEIDTALTPEGYLRRADALGAGIRLSAGVDSDRPDRENHLREQFMAHRIAQVRAEVDGTVMVITGAFHTSGLQTLLATGDHHNPALDPTAETETGHHLVPSSYESLDQNAGYLAGQPDPGFYDRIFHADGDEPVVQLFHRAIGSLRQRKVFVSPADTIAAMTTARALQQLRGHGRLWRDDLIDGIGSVLVKDELDADHPLLQAVHRALRGDQVGKLAAGTPAPPLVAAVQAQFDELGLARQGKVVLDLENERERRSSHLLHSLEVLAVPGITLDRDVTDTTPGAITSRTTVDTRQHWTIRWSDASEAALLLAGRWGPTLPTAVTAALARQLADGSVDALARVLLTAARCGLADLSKTLAGRLTECLYQAQDLVPLGRTVSVLIRLAHFDHWLGTTGRADLVGLLDLTFERAVRSVERLPSLPAGPVVAETAAALRTVVESLLTVEQTADITDLIGELRLGLAAQLAHRHTPEWRGALTGADWLLTGDPQAAFQGAAGESAGVGEFYAGLLAVARHLAVTSPQVFDVADQALAQWTDEEFLEALPDLRRAMSPLNRGERQSLLRHLTGEAGGQLQLEVTEETLLDLAARESALWAAATHWTGSLVGHG